MAIIVSRNNFGRPLPKEEQEQMNLTENREVARTLERVLMRLYAEAEDRNGQKTTGNAFEGKADGKPPVA